MVKYITLLQVIKDYNIKCQRTGSKPTSGLISKKDSPQFQPRNNFNSSFFLDEDELQEIGEMMAKRYGLVVLQIDEDNFILYDKKNETVLNFSEHINYPVIDFTNRGQDADYNLDDLLFYYDSLPTIMKKSVGRIRFSLEEGGASYCINQDGINEVVMTNESTMHEKGSYYNAQMVLYHECGHALDNYLDLNHHIGDSKEYLKGMGENMERFASEYGKNYYSETWSGKEDFAETVAMVCFDRLKDKSNGLIVMDSGVLPWREEKFDEFKEKHKETWSFVNKLITGKISPKQLSYYS